jgi:hypothetical protein
MMEEALVSRVEEVGTSPRMCCVSPPREQKETEWPLASLWL